MNTDIENLKKFLDYISLFSFTQGLANKPSREILECTYRADIGDYRLTVGCSVNITGSNIRVRHRTGLMKDCKDREKLYNTMRNELGNRSEVNSYDEIADSMIFKLQEFEDLNYVLNMLIED